MHVVDFRKAVWAHFKTNGRHSLPWRKTKDPYKILVSEIMLQQTQVERVIPYYKRFIAKYPTAKTLARVPLSDVLRAWQGLGYNRRAKMLHMAAKEIAKHGFPKNLKALEELPGVGPYTARAVAAFAFNHDAPVIETNIRTAIMHHFFPQRTKVSDVHIEKVLTKAHPKGKSREWHSALMDYGSHLKRSGIRINKKSAHYTKQSPFVGSMREVRGAILRTLSSREVTYAELVLLAGSTRIPQLSAALRALIAEGLVTTSEGIYMLSVL